MKKGILKRGGLGGVDIGLGGGGGKDRGGMVVGRDKGGIVVRREEDGEKGGGGKKVRWEEEGDGGGIEEASEQLWREMREGWRRV